MRERNSFCINKKKEEKRVKMDCFESTITDIQFSNSTMEPKKRASTSTMISNKSHYSYSLLTRLHLKERPPLSHSKRAFSIHYNTPWNLYSFIEIQWQKL